MIWAHFFCCKNDLRTLFVAKTIYAHFLSRKRFTHFVRKVCHPESSDFLGLWATNNINMNNNDNNDNTISALGDQHNALWRSGEGRPGGQVHLSGGAIVMIISSLWSTLLMFLIRFISNLYFTNNYTRRQIQIGPHQSREKSMSVWTVSIKSQTIILISDKWSPW